MDNKIKFLFDETYKIAQRVQKIDQLKKEINGKAIWGKIEEKVKDIRNYIMQGVLWQAFTAPSPVVLLIDEIDKADIEFPNDLLRELDQMQFHVYETRETISIG